MKTLRTYLAEYLKLRHQLGFKLRLAGALLGQFVRYALAQKAAVITTELALEWATQPADCQPSQWAGRLGMVRRFAQYVSASDPRTEVPPPGLLPYRYHRKPPYLYRDEEVRRLILTARELASPQHLRGATASTLFGLLAATGMRVGEAISLDRQDVDRQQDLLTVRHAKGNRARLVPIHASTRKALQQYARLRDQICPHCVSPSFFISERGARLTDCTVRYWFIRVSRQTGLRKPTDHRGPRLHDLRHLFSIKTLLQWYRTDQDVETHLPELATYLGHRHVSDTYWYLSATPELLQLATRRWVRSPGGTLS